MLMANAPPWSQLPYEQLILPILPLLNSHAQSKTKDHVACLQRRLTTWRTGNIDALVREGRTFQSQFQTTSSSRRMGDQQEDQTARLFINPLSTDGRHLAKLMFLQNFLISVRLSLEVRVISHMKHGSINTFARQPEQGRCTLSKHPHSA